MPEFVSFFVVLLAAVGFSALFNKLHLPWVIALIIGGVVIGPFGFNVFTPDETIEFLGQIGLVFLMFMAGLETRLSVLKKNSKGVFGLAIVNGLIPFVIGFGVAWLFGYGLLAAILLGIIFISTSVAIVVPSLEANNLIETRLGSLLIGSTVLQDIVSLVLLSIMLQVVKPVTELPLWALYTLLVGALVGLRVALPKLEKFLIRQHAKGDLFQQELRVIFALLIGVVIVFELLGLHPIIAGFFAGVVLSEFITSQILKEKIRAVSYGLFIPIFFVLIGTRTNLQVFFEVGGFVLLAASIVLGSVIAKFVSGYLAARWQKFNGQQAVLIGAATTPSLSTTLAVAFTGLEFGLLTQEIVTALVLLSIVTTMIGPGVIAALAKKV